MRRSPCALARRRNFIERSSFGCTPGPEPVYHRVTLNSMEGASSWSTGPHELSFSCSFFFL